MNHLPVFVEQLSTRMKYIFDVLVQNEYGLSVLFITDEDEFKKVPGAKINFSKREIKDAIQIIPHSILSDFSIKDYPVEVYSHQSFQKIFFKTGKNEIPFDLFGASFWLLSRYEEYLPHKTDSFNRFHFKSSLAYQHNFLHLPLINIWMDKLNNLICEKYPDFKITPRTFNFISSFDVDNAFRYKNKGFIRTCAGYLLDVFHFNWKSIVDRSKVLLNKIPDPFNNFDFIIQANKQRNIQSIFFFLLGDYGINDKNISATKKKFQVLIKHIGDYSAIGIHPSYASGKNLKQLKIEVSRLANITHRQVFNSRQHFAVLKFPYTYNALLQAGITDDYSMGYTNMNGFRASYCYPYKWYNIEEESVSSLLIHSFVFSANTVDYLKNIHQHTFIEEIKGMVEETKKFGGELISVFHNDALTPEMKLNYEAFLKLID
ncbi:MAG: polysaccharide deacetylase family protein [Sphingobacteriaceae bacterium]|nr:polysaccharide deacetylase family protein [Sphingobacteriaceae bacterium]